jgi:putative endonuclease
MMKKKCYVYILQCADNTFYTGWTTDIENRLLQHNKGLASKYTRVRVPVSLFYLEEFQSKSEAMKREYAIKKLSRAQKKALGHKAK